MEFILRDEIKELMRRKGEYCVSIFAPTHRVGRETEQDPIRLDNLLRGAEKELVARGMRSPVAKQMLAPAMDLVRNGFFTRRLADGLSIFVSPELFRYFRTPIHFEERLFVGNQFHVKPLIPLLNSGKRFLILGVSRKSVTLFDCTEFGISEIQLPDVPQGMSEALGYDDTEARQLFKAAAQASNSKNTPMFHGHGGGAEADKEYLFNYFQTLKDSLRPYLRDQNIPLVFAGVEYLFPFFKQTNAYQNTLDKIIEGNPEGLDPRELLKRGIQVARPYFHQEQEKAMDRYMDLLGGSLARNSIEEILPAAYAGRIDTLFVDPAVQKWGKFDESFMTAEVHSEPQIGDEDLIDMATALTCLNGGDVFAPAPGQLPDAAEAAAIFRY